MTTNKGYADGYQAALKDILAAVENGGPEAAVEWANNNLRKS